jgi:hypothetical protein
VAFFEALQDVIRDAELMAYAHSAKVSAAN